jgi:CubicO group peptidase (beta-lactamase class C family)
MTFPFTRREVRLDNWRAHPFNTWSFQNVAELVPVAELPCGGGEIERSPGADGLADLRLTAPDGRVLTALRHLEASHGDAFVALRDGRIVAEWYAPHCDALRPHLVFSVTKSVTGILAGIAAGEGLLDPDAPTAEYVETRAGSAFADARVRDLLDMTVSLRFEENYLDRESDFDRYRRAMLWNPERAAGAEETLHAVLAALPRDDRAHGTRFHYASPVTDMLGLVLEAATGMRYRDWLRDRLWMPMGARGAANITVDREGTARAAGGLSLTARDLARFGQLVLDDGLVTGVRIVPASWIADMRGGGNRAAWLDGDFATLFPDGRYRSCWYDTGDGKGSLAAIGIHEQWIWIDPSRGVVLVKMSSRPEPSHDPSTMREVAMLSQIAAAI